MTDFVKGKAEELKYSILNSEEYKTFDMYRRKLNEDPELKRKVNDFRAANLYMQIQKGKEGGGDAQGLANEHTELLSNTLVRDFMNSELILCKMMQKINSIILSELELELDFL